MEEDDLVKKGVGLVIGGVVIIVLLIMAFSTFYTVESGTEAVLLTWDKAEPVGIGAGPHFKIPIAQRVVMFDMQTQKYGADASQSTLESAASADLQQVKIRLTLNYHLAQGTAPSVFTNIGANYQDIVIVPTVHEVVKATTAKYKAVDLIGLREQVSQEMENLLKEKLAPYNIVVEQVSITDFDFSEQFNQAIEAKVTAEQQKQKADNDLQRIKVEAEQVKTAAEGQRDARIATAQAEAETTRLNAIANAEKIKITAEAESLRVRLIQEQLKASPNYIELQRVQQWNGVYPNFYMAGGQSPTLLMQVPDVK